MGSTPDSQTMLATMTREAFAAHPFGIDLANLKDTNEALKMLPSVNEWLSQFEELSQAMGKQWMTDALAATPSDDETRDACMDLLHKHSQSGVYPSDASDPLYAPRHQELRQRLDEVVGKLQSPSYSIAFFGLVKAGYGLCICAYASVTHHDAQEISFPQRTLGT